MLLLLPCAHMFILPWTQPVYLIFRKTHTYALSLSCLISFICSRVGRLSVTKRPKETRLGYLGALH